MTSKSQNSECKQACSRHSDHHAMASRSQTGNACSISGGQYVNAKVKQWEDTYELLLLWGRDVEGGNGKSCEVPPQQMYKGVRLGEWLKKQKQTFRGEDSVGVPMEPFRKQKLQALVTAGMLQPLLLAGTSLTNTVQSEGAAGCQRVTCEPRLNTKEERRSPHFLEPGRKVWPRGISLRMIQLPASIRTHSIQVYS